MMDQPPENQQADQHHKAALLKQYIENPGNVALQQILANLGVLESPLILKNPDTIFEFDWIEGFGATIYTLVTRIEYALQNNMYFAFKNLLGFGNWTDFFQPFLA